MRETGEETPGFRNEEQAEDAGVSVLFPQGGVRGPKESDET